MKFLVWVIKEHISFNAVHDNQQFYSDQDKLRTQDSVVNNFNSGLKDNMPMCAQILHKNVLVKLRKSNITEVDNIVKSDRQSVESRNDTKDGNGHWVVKKSSYSGDYRTRLSSIKHRLSSQCVKTIVKPFVHRVTGAAKQMGVVFSNTLPNGYIPPKTYLAHDARPDAYFQTSQLQPITAKQAKLSTLYNCHCIQF